MIDDSDPEMQELILTELGEIARAKYDEFVSQNRWQYDLSILRGSLQYEMDFQTFDNHYYLEGRDMHWTKIAKYFEYGTGLRNVLSVGRSYTTGRFQKKADIVPLYAKALKLKIKDKDGKQVMAKYVKGVKPVLAMTDTIAYMEKNRHRLQMKIERYLTV